MNIPDFTDTEWQLVNQILFERYSRLVPLQAVDVDLQLDPASQALTTCPALYWEALGAEFIVAKVADQRYRCQFFYSAQEQFGTGRDVYDNLGDCVTTLLRLQADHQSTRSSALTETLGTQTPAQDEDYHGPLVI
ncbi:MAG: hypothetical protein A3H93_09720 [Rhodocyclales bacterium RIFCSPLOWO2_02_FULL_63_24]|nr:MAG: hypothetical protein A3H93_09720 [Rhodocyclales bacterium RIFCSPLOWO2_02_FULL_63_24]